MANEDKISQHFRGEAGRPKGQERQRDRIHWLVANARGRVLDLGCSQGIASMLCARSGLEVLGIDQRQDRINYALADREAKPAEVRQRLEFRVGDPTALELPDDAFDTVILGEALELLGDPDSLLLEAARVAAPDAIVLLATPLGYSPRHEHRQTLYVGSLVETLAPHLTVDSIEIVDGYLRVLARPGTMPAGRAAEVIVAAQPQLEQALFDRQRSDWKSRRKRLRRAERLGRRLRRVERTQRRLRRRIRKQSRRLAARRRSRWSRLGGALSAARTPRGLLAFPSAAVQALRRLPEPPPDPRRDKGAARAAPGPGELKVRSLVTTADSVAGTDDDLRVEVPEAAPLPDGPTVRPELRVATILDPFSASAFRYEWSQIEVGPEDWLERLEPDPPDLLFVESAWRGNGDRWAQAVVGLGPHTTAFGELVAWCRARRVPTVFWNKEDPPRFSTFMPAAALFDHILTTDSNLVGSYQEAIGNESVSTLMFGAQPRVHNPVAPSGGRRHAVAFAGTYIGHKHPARRGQMETILEPALDFDLHIFARVPPGQRARFEWPEKYLSHIVGSLPYERMVTAYKAYRLFLNVNTVVNSPTMCARRAFEISATATPVLSGDSRALREVFGDLVSIATDPDETRAQIESLLGDAELAGSRGHAAMRHVLRDHTYGRRVDQILRRAGLSEHLRDTPPSVSAVVPVGDQEVPSRLREQLAGQSRPPHEVIEASSGEARAATGDLVALVDPAHSYEEHYLEDLTAAFSYTDAAVVGKGVTGDEHAYSLDLHPATLIAPTELVRDLDVAAGSLGPSLLEACETRGLSGYAADRYSFRPAASSSGAGSGS